MAARSLCSAMGNTIPIKEYERDLAKGLNPDVPLHYFRNDDPDEEILVTWKAHAHLFYTNWVNYYVYQTTPYYLDKM